MAAITSHRKLDPIGYFQYRNHPNIVSKILQAVPKFSDWHACSLVNKRWNRVNEKRNPRMVLIKAIEDNRFDIVVALLDQGLSPKFRIAGTKFVSGAENTPYLRAISLGFDRIASTLKEKDGTFSEEFVKKKLDCLRFDIANYSFSIQGQVFQQQKTAGVGHEFHHEYLLPDLIRTLEAFFMQRPDCTHWNQAKSKQLIGALQRSKELCPSCSPGGFKEKRVDPDELVIFSDTSAFKHQHWVTFALKNFHYAVGNRGGGCEKHPGAKIYKRDSRFNKLNSDYLVSWNKLDPSLASLYLKSSYQDSGSCSRASLEAGGVLGGIGVILCDDYEAQGKKLGPQELQEINVIALSIIQELINFDHELSLKKIMNKDEKIAHDQDLFVRYLASLQSTSEVAENFYRFLASHGPIDWFKKDIHHRLPWDYVPKKYYLYNDVVVRDRLNLDTLINKVICKAKSELKSKDIWFWDQLELLNKYGLMRGLDVQNRTVTAYATFESCSSEYTARGGLFKLSYNLKSKACALNVTIPVQDRHKLVNVFVCFLKAWYSHKIKFTSMITKFLPDENFISFDICFCSSSLCREFIDDLRDAYKLKDMAKKYAHEPHMPSVIKEMKKIDAQHRKQSYSQLYKFANKLTSSGMTV